MPSAVSQTSLSRPVAPSRRARANASSVFSGRGPERHGARSRSAGGGARGCEAGSRAELGTSGPGMDRATYCRGVGSCRRCICRRCRRKAGHRRRPSQMATIRATCGDCGDVELTTADVRVRVCLDDNAGSYHFRCPQCQMAVVKPAEPRIVDLLAASGVEVSMWRLPGGAARAPVRAPHRPRRPPRLPPAARVRRLVRRPHGRGRPPGRGSARHRAARRLRVRRRTRRRTRHRALSPGRAPVAPRLAAP